MTGRTPLGLPQNVTPRAWFRIEDNSQSRPRGEGDTTAAVYVYDAIGGWYGVEASAFVAELSALDVDHIDLFVNSPGGDVYDAIAMTNALRRHRATVTATVDGLAASAASFLITAADDIVMSPNSELMVHDAWGMAIGNAGDMRDYGDQLDRISDNIASMYAAQAGGETADWRAIMLAETWYSAEEAVTAGLANRVEGADGIDVDGDEASNLFDLSSFAHAGRRAAPEPLAPAAIATARRRMAAELNYSPEVIEQRIAAQMTERRNTHPAAPGDTTPTNTNRTEVAPVDDITTRGVMDRLGIPATTALLEPAALLAAVTEALDERAEAPAAAATSRELPEGVVTIDAGTLAELQASATLGAEARAQQITDRRLAVVNTAIDEGRIPPARAEHWLAQLAADEDGATASLATLAPGTINTAAKTVVGGAEQSGDDDSLYNRMFPKTSDTDTTKGA